jgi:RecA-family ATPase
VIFKVFPATLTHDGQKVPLIKGWREAATTDPNQIKAWTEQFGNRIAFWGVPTGVLNGIYVLDVDVKGDNGFQTLQGLKLPKTMTQTTPSKGAHYIFKYPNGGGAYGNRVKFMPGLDTRGEGGWIAWYGATNDPIANCPDWILGATGKLSELPIGQTIRVAPSIAEGIVLKSLEAIREAPPGESNNVLNVESFRLGQLIASGAITRDNAENMLFLAAKERGKPDYEAKATIKSGLDGGSKNPLVSPFNEPIAHINIPAIPGQPARWTPNKFTMEDLMNTEKLRKPQLFRDWSSEDIHITTADGGTGKTTLKLYEAMCLANGDHFLGFQCLTPGKTLFITGEDTAAKLGAMIGALAKQMGLFEQPERLQRVLESIVVKKDSDLCIISKDRQGFLHPNPQAMARVLEAVHDIKPKMIVFDPISSFWGSEAALNDMAKAVIKFVSNLVDESGACVELINHMGKVSSANKDMTQFAGRGGTGLPSHARVSRVLRSLNEEEYYELTNRSLENGISALMCNVNKFSDGSPLVNKPFIITRKGFLFERENLDPKKQREENERISDTERVFKFVQETRSSGKYPTKNVIIGHFMVCGDKMSESRVKRAIDMLQFMGHEGLLLKSVHGPDALNKEQVFVITDSDGKEM